MSTPTPEMMASDWFKKLWQDAKLDKLERVPLTFAFDVARNAGPVTVSDDYQIVVLRKPDGAPLRAGDIEAGSTIEYVRRMGRTVYIAPPNKRE